MIVFTTRGQEREGGGRLEPELPDTVGLVDPSEVETGRGLLTGLHVLPEQSLVLSRLEIRKLLELE